MQFFKPVNTIKAITFDLDDTLYNNDPIIRQADAALNAHLQRHYPKAAALSPEQWQQLKRDAIAANPSLSSDMGKLRLIVLKAALANDINGTTSQDCADDELEKAAIECFNCFYTARSEFELAQEVHDTLLALSNQLPLIGITNGNVDPEKIGLAPYFNVILHASTSRPMKPARAMFDEAADILGIEPKNILHVGDNMAKDIYGAINAGFQSAWFACNREMHLPRESVSVLPHVVLEHLDELRYFCE